MDFFSHKRFRFPHKEVDVSACAIPSDTRDMLRQMALPLIPERRVKGALSVVSRETGLPFSKVRRLYYGITDHVLAFEWQAIKAAWQRYVEHQEQKLEAELAQLRALRTARRQGELFDADTPNSTGMVAASLDLVPDET